MTQKAKATVSSTFQCLSRSYPWHRWNRHDLVHLLVFKSHCLKYVRLLSWIYVKITQIFYFEIWVILNLTMLHGSEERLPRKMKLIVWILFDSSSQMDRCKKRNSPSKMGFIKERQLGQRDKKTTKPYGFKALGIESIFIKFQPGLNS